MFVHEYLVDRNATQAAIRAGYSLKNVYAQASRLLRHVHVRRAIGERLTRMVERLEVTQERVLIELARIAFAEIRSVVDWTDDGVTVVFSEALDPNTASAVAEASQTWDGLRIKMPDKLGACTSSVFISACLAQKHRSAAIRATSSRR